MKLKNIQSLSIADNYYRLDVGPYVSGAIEVRETIEKSSYKKEPLHYFTLCGKQGIYHAGRESRSWVDEEEFGVKFLGSTDVLKVNTSDLPLISRKQVKKTPAFLIRHGYTLISRSGTIGRMAYCRRDMDMLACSEHVMRVVPDSKVVWPGYIYAFLNSKFGVPLVVSSTYGSIIQSIEPHHVEDLRIPIIPKKIEKDVHEKIEKAASLRQEAAELLNQAIDSFESAAKLKHFKSTSSVTPYFVREVSALNCSARMDAIYHSEFHQDIVDEIKGSGFGVVTVSHITKSIIEPGRFKRNKVQSSENAIPFFGTAALFLAEPKANYHIPANDRKIGEFFVGDKTLLIPRSGSINGIIGKVVFPYGEIVNGAVSEDAIRINCHTEEDAGYLYVFLSSQYGFRQLKGRVFGSAIPHLDVKQIGKVILPDLSKEKICNIGSKACLVRSMRDEAINIEKAAISLLEKTIDKSLE